MELISETCCSAIMSPKMERMSAKYQNVCASQMVVGMSGQEKAPTVAAAATAHCLLPPSVFVHHFFNSRRWN